MRTNSALHVVAFVLISTAPALAAAPPPAIDAAMDRAITSGREVGITLAVERNGKIAFERAYGMRDRERRLPATLDTAYEIGSVTKEMTAAAVMQLVQAGKIDLDARLSRYMPGAPFAADVTIRQLLSMTSGIPEYLTGPKLLSEVQKPVTVQQLLARVSTKPLNFRPGSAWQHSNTNYLLLGMLIARTSGLPYEQYVRERVLDRAHGANFLTVRDEAQLPQMAVGYARGARASTFDDSWIEAAGNLVGTVSDMMAWDRALSGGSVISPPSYDEMTTLQTPPGSMTGYGFAFFLDTYRGQPRIWQDGSTIGFNVCDQYYPSRKTRIIVFTNNSDGTGYADALAQVVFDLLYPPVKR